MMVTNKLPSAFWGAWGTHQVHRESLNMHGFQQKSVPVIAFEKSQGAKAEGCIANRPIVR